MTKYLLPFGLAVTMTLLQAGTTAPSSRWNAEHPMQNARAQASDTVNRMLRETHWASRAIRDDNTPLAKVDVNKALQIASQLTATHTGSGDLIPLYSELGQYTMIGPSRRTASGANANTAQANANTSTHVAVRQVVGNYTSVALDLNLAKTHLQAAQQALNNGNTQAALQALRGVQDSVLESSVATDLPLLRARENLMLARAAVNQGEYGEAHAALRAASQALATYDQSGGSHANAAQQLRNQIASYNQSIRQNHANASAQIESWWNQVSGWETPATPTARG